MSTDGGRAAGGNRSKKISGDSGYVADYTPPNAVAMVDQATIDAFLRTNPNLPFRDPVGYYKWIYGDGTVGPSTDPSQDKSQYFYPASGDPSKFVNQPLNSQTDKSFLQGGAAGAWALPLMVAGAGVADMGGLNAALTPTTTAASTTPDLSWAANLTDAAGGSLANPAAAGSAYSGLAPSVVDPFLNPDVMNNMTGPNAQFPADAVNGANGLPIPATQPPAPVSDATPLPPTPPTTPGPTVPPGISSLLNAGMALPDILKAIQSGVGIASGANTLLNPTTAVDPAMIDALWKAGQDTYNRSLTPNTALTGNAADVLQAGRDAYTNSLIPNADLKAKTDAAYGAGMDTYNRSLIPNADLKAKADAAFAAGQNTYNTALDPQGALYARTLQQLQDATRASSAAHGTAMSPFSTGVENKAVSDFNIDWQNQQLQRQIAGSGALTAATTPAVNYGAQEIQRQGQGVNAAIAGTAPSLTFNEQEQQRQQQALVDYINSMNPTLTANAQELQRQQQGTQAFTGAGNVAAQAGLANNAQAFMQNQVGTNALTTGVGTLSDWLKNIWGAGNTANPNAPTPTSDSTPTGGFNMNYFSQPVQQPGTYYAS